MSIDLTQAEAEDLMAMPKRSCSDEIQMFPSLGGKLLVELESMDKTENFYLDVTRSRIDFARITYQNRARVVVVLKRLDLNGSPHRNPDDQIIPCHISTLIAKDSATNGLNPFPLVNSAIWRTYRRRFRSS